MNTIRKIVLGTALAASAVTVAAPASARDYYGHRGNDGTAVAIGAGMIGLALGAAIASSNHHDSYDDRYRYERRHHHNDRDYYRQGYRGTYGQYDNRYYGNTYNGNGYNGYNGGDYNGYGY